jgi:Tol biopolymer transport system component
MHRWRAQPIPWPQEPTRQTADGAAAGDLVITGDGYPHLVIGSGDLIHAYRGPDGWSFETVAAGDYPSLARDADDQLHVTYHNQTSIHYAVRSADGWDIKHTVDAADYPNALALDAQDRPHIAYLAPTIDGGAPAYAMWDGSGWTESIVAPGWRSRSIGLALDASGSPTVVYEGMEGSTYQLRSSVPAAGSGWTQNVLIELWNYATSIYDWRPGTIQVSADSDGSMLTSLAYGDQFIIKPSDMTYFVWLYRQTPAGLVTISGSGLWELGYPQSAPSTVVHGAGLDGAAFLSFVIDGALWFGDTSLGGGRPEQIGHATEVIAVAAGVDGQPHIVFRDDGRLWYGYREAIPLTHQAYLPAIGLHSQPPVGVNELISVDSAGDQFFGNSGSPSVSGDGRLVAFESEGAPSAATSRGYIEAPKLFVRDRYARQTWCVSVDTTGACRTVSRNPVISEDGRAVAFETSACLRPEDTDLYYQTDVYLYDIITKQVLLVSADLSPDDNSSYASHASISADGSQVAYLQGGEVRVYDRLTETWTRLPGAPDGYAGDPAISADGRLVAFTHTSDTLVAGDSNGLPDVFVYDRETAAMERVSVATDGTESDGASTQPQLSADGRYVVFTTEATNLDPGDRNGALDVYLHDRATGETQWISRDPAQVGGASFAPSITADGRVIAFESYATFGNTADTNSYNDIYVAVVGHNPVLQSVAVNGLAGNSGSATPDLSGDGRFLVFKSAAGDLTATDHYGFTDVFWRRIRE